MAYYEEYIIAGKTVEVTKKHKIKKKKERSKKNCTTSEEQKNVNRNHAIKRLRLLLNNNFRDGTDFHIVLTYQKELRPKTKDETRNCLENFMRDLRNLYKKLKKVLKYITVTEYKRVSIHHHIVINDADIREINKLWKYGKINATPLYTDGQYGELAEYLIKETDKTFSAPDAIYKKRWNPSKTLKKPIVIKKIIHAKLWRQEPKPKKGYYIDKASVYNGVNPFTGGYYQFYRMIKLESG